MKHEYGADVVCPYYKDELQQIIRCEGVDDNSVIHLAFNAKDKLRLYRSEFCERCYRRCLIAQMLNRKWDYE